MNPLHVAFAGIILAAIILVGAWEEARRNARRRSEP